MLIMAWKKKDWTVLLYGLIAISMVLNTGAQVTCEWPCFHGLDRNNKSPETGLLTEWPENGPELLWTVSGLGEGYSSVTISGGLLYTAGMKEKQTYVFAFDLNGKPVWQQPNGVAWETTMSWARTYTGARSTPTWDNGVVYHLGELGRLTAFESQTGKPIWSFDIREWFEAEIPEYGYSESVYIDGEQLYCNAAGKKGFIVCLDKKNGARIWSNTEIPGTAAFSSPVIAEFDGYRQVIGMSSNCVYGIDARIGKLLWTVPYENKRSLNIPDPIFYNGFVFVSSGYGKGSSLIKLTVSGGKILPETVWQTPMMDNHHGGVILLDGYLYGSGDNERGWFCLDFMTGKQQWKAPGKGSLTYADHMLYCLEEKGTMKLVKAVPDDYQEVGAFKVPEGGKGMYWAHPVICGGRLYIRHTDMLFAYDIKKDRINTPMNIQIK
jgi:outer membrane protein assembly factor BamB